MLADIHLVLSGCFDLLVLRIFAVCPAVNRLIFRFVIQNGFGKGRRNRTLAYGFGDRRSATELCPYVMEARHIRLPQVQVRKLIPSSV